MADDTPGDTHLGHVHMKVSDTERAVDFYTSVLDLSVRERHDRFVFLTYGDHHHDVALQEVGASAPGTRGAVGLYHAAFEVDSPDRLAAVHRRLQDGGVAVTAVDHGISKALYFDDPDGNGLEVYFDTRDERGRTDWTGQNEPFDPAQFVDDRSDAA
jgi:catechol 2,3-dioxygenase